MALFYRYCGKFHKSEQNISSGDSLYHLLPYHCLDVAACGYLLVKQNHYQLADILTEAGLPTEQAAEWFAYFLATHDLGKFASNFQRKCSHLSTELMIPDPMATALDRHDCVGFWLWRALIDEHPAVFYSDKDLSCEFRLINYLTQWMEIMTGHHGQPPTYQGKLALCCSKQDRQAATDWLIALKHLFPLSDYPTTFSTKEALTKLKLLSWLLAGVTVLADWLGSNKNIFNYQSEAMPVADYWQQYAIPHARRALQHIPASSELAPFNGIASLFPFIQQPTPLQHHALQVDISCPGPQLFILEDVTGAGKTEAALILAHRLMSAGKAHGLYVALPTMATANAMYSRLGKVYRAFYLANHKPSLILAHSARQMINQFSQSVWPAEYMASVHTDPAIAQDMPQAGCQYWFTDSRKKALLAEVGVGTLDQALLAVLPFRHQCLRLLGLRNKLLILDEVHAYDHYTSSLLGQLLYHHAMQGGSAIVLTATLPLNLRRNLLNEFNKGLAAVPLRLEQHAGYPWFSQLTQQGLTEIHVETRQEVQRSVAIQWFNHTEQGIDIIQQTVKQGKCVCWIKNTVDDAIQLYQQLKQVIPEQDLLLFHSRFAFCDRFVVEEQTLQWFGKDSTSTVRRGKVLIATQVVEQSLDLDFDVLLSDLAPIDLLIQRAGRLQRHRRDGHGDRLTNREAAEGRGPAILYILAPEWTENPDKDWPGALLRGSAAVYQDHSLLWLTQSILQQQGGFSMPQDCRPLIEYVYSGEQPVPAILDKIQQQQQGKALSERSLARQNVLDLSQGYTRQSASSNWSNDIEISTRLGEEMTDIYLCHYAESTGDIKPYADGEFAWEKSLLRLRKAKWRQIEQQLPILRDEVLERQQKQLRHPHAQFLVLPSQQNNDFYTQEMGFWQQSPINKQA